MVQTQPDQPQTSPQSTPPGDDPLSHLFKMSKTAGLGSGEYVAVNGTAVFALLLGFASALTLLEPLLLLIPLVGIVVSIMAFVQIARSNGTQTGKGIVVVAVLLILGFGGSVFALKIREEVRTREDRAAIAEVVKQIAANAKSGDFAKSYPLFSSRFHDQFKLADFVDRMKVLGASEVYGKLKDVTTGLMEFQTDDSTGTRFAIVRINFDFEKTKIPVPDDLTFRKEGDRWFVEGFQTLYPPPNPRDKQQPQSGPGMTPQ